MSVVTRGGSPASWSGPGTRRSFLALLAAVASLALPGAARASAHRTVVTTGYCPCEACCGPNSPAAGGAGLTASGERPHQGVTVAADWSVFPAGTRLFIQNVGRRVVQDRGGRIVGERIDVFFRAHQEALAFGRRRLRVRVLG
jgi:3D (Asp-Asp-Asp) domain-containing protein